MHRTTPRFWKCLNSLRPPVKKIAEENFKLLTDNPRHPSLHFKKVGKFWSARVGMNHRALLLKMGTILFGYGLVSTMSMIG